MAATLFDTLVSQGVKPGDTYNVQSQLYSKLGAPMGNYSGTAQQNEFILGKLGSSHYNDILGGSSPNASSGGGSGGDSSGGGGISVPQVDTNLDDYYSQALAKLQPIANTEIAPIQQEQALLPGIYQQKQTALNQDITDIQNTTAQQQKEVQDQGTQQSNQIGAANMAAQGQQRAAAAARGITETSGVEQSQEANIQAGSDQQRTALATNIANKLADLGLSETHDINQIQQQIANLPNQQAMDSLNYASQIAQINGQTAKDAMTMAQQMLSANLDAQYKAFDEAIKQENLQLAQERLDEMAQYHQAELGIRQMSASISAGRLQVEQQNAQYTQMKDALGANFNNPVAMFTKEILPSAKYTDYSSGSAQTAYNPNQVWQAIHQKEQQLAQFGISAQPLWDQARSMGFKF